jgi:hypothetical protein
VGWWRRVELEIEKLDNKRRELEENRRRKEENKLEFLRKFYPNISTTPGGSERLRSGKKNLTDLEHPTKSNKMEEFSFSPHSKRTVGGGELIGAHELYSPAKRLKLTKQLSFWESGSSYLEGPDSKMADYLGGNNRLGGNKDCI